MFTLGKDKQEEVQQNNEINRVSPDAKLSRHASTINSFSSVMNGSVVTATSSKTPAMTQLSSDDDHDDDDALGNNYHSSYPIDHFATKGENRSTLKTVSQEINENDDSDHPDSDDDSASDNVFGLSFLKSMSENLPSLGGNEHIVKRNETTENTSSKNSDSVTAAPNASIKNDIESANESGNKNNNHHTSPQNVITTAAENDVTKTISDHNNDNKIQDTALKNDDKVSHGQELQNLDSAQNETSHSSESTYRLQEARSKIKAATKALSKKKNPPRVGLIDKDKFDSPAKESSNEILSNEYLSTLTSQDERIEKKEKGVVSRPYKDSFNALEFKKTISTISTLTNELSELRKLRSYDKQLIERREGQVQNLSCLLSAEKEITRQKKMEIFDLEKKILGLEQVIVSDQYDVDEAYVSHKIKEIEEERDKLKSRVQDLEKNLVKEKDSNIGLSGQLETYQSQNNAQLEQISRQQNSMKISADNLDRTERLLQASIEENEKLRTQIKGLEQGIFSGSNDLERMMEEKLEVVNERDNLKELISCVQKEHDQVLENLFNMVEKLHGDDRIKISAAKPKFGDVMQAIASLNDAIAQQMDIEIKFSAQEKICDNLQTQLYAAEELNKNLRNDKRKFEDKIRILEDEIQEEKKSFQFQLSSQTKLLHDQNAKVKESSNDLRRAKRQLEDKIKELDYELIKQRDIKESDNRKLEKMEKDLEAAKKKEVEIAMKYESEHNESLKMSGKIEILEMNAKDQSVTLQNFKLKLSEVEKKNDELKVNLKQKEELEKDNNTHKERIISQNVELELLRKEITSSRESLARSENKNKELDQKLMTLEKTIASEDKDLEQLAQILKESESKNDKYVEEISTQQSLHEEEKVKLNMKMTNMSLKIENLEKQLSCVRADLNDALQTIENFRTEKERDDCQYSVIQMESSSLKENLNLRISELDKLKKELSYLQIKNSQLEKEKESLDDHISVLEVSIEEEKKHTKNLTDQLYSLNLENVSNINNVSELESSLEKVQDENSNLLKQIETLSFELNEYQQARTDLNIERNASHNSLYSMMSNKKDEIAQGHKLKSCTFANNQQTQYEVQDETNTKLEIDIDNLKKSNQKLMEQVRNLEIENRELREKKSSNPFEKLQQSPNNLPLSPVADGIRLWESKTNRIQQDITSKQKDLEKVATRLETCETGMQTIEIADKDKIECMANDLSSANEKINELLMEVVGFEASLERCENEKEELYGELRDMVDVISELMRELESTESQRLDYKQQLERKTDNENEIRNNGDLFRADENVTFDKMKEKIDFDSIGDGIKNKEERDNNIDTIKEQEKLIADLKNMFERVSREKIGLENKLNSFENKIRKWREDFSIVKQMFSPNYSFDDSYFDGISDISAILPVDDTTTSKTLEEHHDDLISSNKDLFQKLMRSREKILVLENTLKEIKTRTHKSSNDAAFEFAELQRAKEATEAEMRRADNAEKQLTEVLDLLEDSNNELTEAVNVKCSLESQLHEAFLAMSEFEYGTRSDKVGQSIIDGKLESYPSNKEGNMFEESINLMKCLTNYLRKDLELKDPKKIDHISDPWRNLGRMSKLISDHEKTLINETIDNSKTLCESSVTSSLSNDTGIQRLNTPFKAMVELNTSTTVPIPEIEVNPSPNAESNETNRLSFRSVEYRARNRSYEKYKSKTKVKKDLSMDNDEYISEFNALIREGELNLQNALDHIIFTPQKDVEESKEDPLNATFMNSIDSRKFDYIPNIVNPSGSSPSLKYFMDRCENAEQERDLILADALQLVESSKEARDAEIKAAEANIRKISARELTDLERNLKIQIDDVTKFMNTRYNKMRLFYCWKLDIEKKKRNKRTCTNCRGGII